MVRYPNAEPVGFNVAGIVLALAVAFGTHQANEAARWRYEAQGMGQTEIVTPQNQNTAVQP